MVTREVQEEVIGRIAELHGSELKKALLKPGNWTIGMGGFGEVLPYHENKMYLDYNKIDTFGLPKIVFDAEFKENEIRMKVGKFKRQKC